MGIMRRIIREGGAMMTVLSQNLKGWHKIKSLRSGTADRSSGYGALGPLYFFILFIVFT